MSASRATSRRSSSAVSALRRRGSPSSANSSATSASSSEMARPIAQRAVERRFDQARRLGFVGEVEAGIDAGFERELVQQRQAERVDGADGDVAERVANLAPALAASALPSRCRCRSVAITRCRISAAALRVKVIARMLRGATPRLAAAARSDRPARASCRCRPRLRARRSAADRPPAAARARRRLVQRLARRRVEVEAAAAQLIGRPRAVRGPPGCRQTATNAHIVQRFLRLRPRREVAGGDVVERRDQPMPGRGRQLVERLAAFFERHDRLRPFERQVHRLAGRDVAAVRLSTATCGRTRCRSAAAAPACDRARTSSCSRSAGTCRRRSRSTRSILARRRTVARLAVFAGERELAVELVFHQALADARRRAPLPSRTRDRRCRSRPPSRTAARARARLRRRQRSQRRSGDLFEQRARLVDVGGGDAAAAARLPLVEERLEQLVQEPAALERRSRISSSGCSSTCSTFAT